MSNVTGTHAAQLVSFPIEFMFDEATKIQLSSSLVRRKLARQTLYRVDTFELNHWSIKKDEIVCTLSERVKRMIGSSANNGKGSGSAGKITAISNVANIPIPFDPDLVYAGIEDPKLVFRMKRNDLLREFKYIGHSYDLYNDIPGDSHSPSNPMSAAGQGSTTFMARMVEGNTLQNYDWAVLALPDDFSSDVQQTQQGEHGRVTFTIKGLDTRDFTMQVFSTLVKQKYYSASARIFGTDVETSDAQDTLDAIHNEASAATKFMFGLLGVMRMVDQVTSNDQTKKDLMDVIYAQKEPTALDCYKAMQIINEQLIKHYQDRDESSDSLVINALSNIVTSIAETLRRDNQIIGRTLMKQPRDAGQLDCYDKWDFFIL